MGTLFSILISIGAFLGFFYFLLIASYCYGWVKTKQLKLAFDDSVFVSVIISARNEEKNISACLEAVLAQKYTASKFEILVIDDHSTDSTNAVLLEYAKKYSQIKCIQLPENVFGKKQAIQAAIEISKGDLIVTTDADCIMGKNWLQSIVSFYLETNAKMIVAPVAFYNEKSLFEKMQSLEFMALIACGGGSLFFDKAIMSNGANLAYQKSAYTKVNGFEGLNEKASGDDVLLMYKIKQEYPKGIHFCKNEEAIVYTEAKKSVREFVQQRKRWASKGFFALNAETKRVSLLIYLFSFYLVFAPIIGAVCLSNSLFCMPFMGFYLILIGIKCFIDFLLLFLSASFFKKKELLFLFFPEQVIYVMYVVLFGLIGSIGNYEWKGRKIN